MKEYIKPKTRPAKTCSGEEIEVKVPGETDGYYWEILKEPFWLAEHDRWHDKGRIFHWSELTFLD